MRSRNPKMWTDLLHEDSSPQPSEQHVSCWVSAIRGTGSTVVTAGRSETGATARTRRCARPNSLIWVVKTPHSVSNGPWKPLPSRYSVSGPESRAPQRVLYGRARSVGVRLGPPARPLACRL
jgi:hypothetical protein